MSDWNKAIEQLSGLAPRAEEPPPSDRDILLPVIASLRLRIAEAANALDAWLDMTGPEAASTVAKVRDDLWVALDLGRGLRASASSAEAPPRAETAPSEEVNQWRGAARAARLEAMEWQARAERAEAATPAGEGQEPTLQDAPPQYNNDEAHAWLAGHQAAQDRRAHGPAQA